MRNCNMISKIRDDSYSIILSTIFLLTFGGSNLYPISFLRDIFPNNWFSCNARFSDFFAAFEQFDWRKL